MGAGASKTRSSSFDANGRTSTKGGPPTAVVASTTFLSPEELGQAANASHNTANNHLTSSFNNQIDTISSGSREKNSTARFTYSVSDSSSNDASSNNGISTTSGAGYLSVAQGSGFTFASSVSPVSSGLILGAPSTSYTMVRNPTSPSQKSSTVVSSTASLGGVSLRSAGDADVASVNNVSMAGVASQNGAAAGPWRLDANTLFPQLRIRNGISATAMSLREMSYSQMKGVEHMSTNDIFSERIIWAAPCNYSFTTCGGQSGPIRSISSSADGSQFAVVVAGVKQCFITDAATGKVTVTIKGHLDPVLSCAQSKDGKFLVTTSADCTVVLWDMTNGKKLREVPVNFQANVCAVSDDSEIVATTSTEDFVHLWDARQCEPLYTFTRHSATIFSVGFCRKGNLFASGATNGEVMVWSYPSGEVRAAFNKHRSSVLAVSFSHDGRRLCTIDKECVRCWDLFTNHCVFARDIKGNVTVGPNNNDDRRGTGPQAADETVRFLSCAMIACNLIVVTQSNRFILVLDPNHGTEILSIQTRAIATAIGCSFNGDTVFIGDMHGNQYKLKLQFLPRDVKAFNLNAKPYTKEKNAKID